MAGSPFHFELDLNDRGDGPPHRESNLATSTPNMLCCKNLERTTAKKPGRFRRPDHSANTPCGVRFGDRRLSWETQFGVEISQDFQRPAGC